MWAGGATLILLAALVIAVVIALRRAQPFMRAHIVAELESRFHSRVELDHFHLSLWNGLAAEGEGLRIWPPTGTIVSGTAGPLISIREFRFRAPLQYQPDKLFSVSQVDLKGLDIDIPPKSHLGHKAVAVAGDAKSGSRFMQFDVSSIVCTDARLTLETNKPGKAPLVFAIEHLKLTHVSEGGAMGFDAELTNPRPVGTIYSKGSFGPWVVQDPGESPVDGDYRFQHANLASFKGIAGILNSTGHYSGTLHDITVDGKTETPDFRLTSGGSAMNLRTRFLAHVDGTNGNTWLQPVDATLGHSHFTANGQIMRFAPEVPNDGRPGHPGGHDIALTVNVGSGRIEDFLRLTSPGQPLLTGAVTMKTSLEIPPGPEPVRDRLRLKGTFVLDGAKFTNPKMQDRIRELSMRGQGMPNESNGGATEQVRSAMLGDFQMANGVVTLPNLQYTVPGAEIDLKGTYGADDGALNFRGNVKMQATISQMVGGWKGMLLSPLDRFFKREGAGTVVPVVITGTRENPQFTVDFGALKKTVPQRPGGE